MNAAIDRQPICTFAYVERVVIATSLVGHVTFVRSGWITCMNEHGEMFGTWPSQLVDLTVCE